MEKYNQQPGISEEEIFTDRVVTQVQAEVGSELMRNPGMTASEIKSQAIRRFVDLVEKELLSEDEAAKCYLRFARMVDRYYGAS